jgi:BMFP domain-containing protein YqiC
MAEGNNWFMTSSSQKEPLRFDIISPPVDREGNHYDLNRELERLRKEREQLANLAQERLEELEKFFRATVDRELRMAELKRRIRELEQKLTIGEREKRLGHSEPVE